MRTEVHRQPSNVKSMPRLLSIKQATFELGISRTVTYELIAAGKLKTVKIGRRRFVAREAIEEFGRATLRCNPTSPHAICWGLPGSAWNEP